MALLGVALTAQRSSYAHIAGNDCAGFNLPPVDFSKLQRLFEPAHPEVKVPDRLVFYRVRARRRRAHAHTCTQVVFIDPKDTTAIAAVSAREAGEVRDDVAATADLLVFFRTLWVDDACACALNRDCGSRRSRLPRMRCSAPSDVSRSSARRCVAQRLHRAQKSRTFGRASAKSDGMTERWSLLHARSSWSGGRGACSCHRV